MEKHYHPAYKHLNFAQKVADSLTKWVGSWFFILSFLIFLLFWITANVYAWFYRWDSYPFILLNLILSTVAAIQAPIILMSQNRQAQRDRVAAEYDYRVNFKAEKEIEEIKKQLDRIERKLR